MKPSSKRIYEYGLAHWWASFSPVSALTRGEVARIRDGLAPGMARNFVSVTSRLLSFAVEYGIIETNPLYRMKKPGVGAHKRWPESLLARYRAEVTGEARDIFELALATGQRVSDLVYMRNADVEDGVLHVKQSKSGSEVWIPIKEFKEIHLTPRQASEVFRYSLRKLGVKGYTLHGLRKTFASRMAEAGASSEEIAAVLGHRTIRMAHHYVKDAERKRLSVQGFNRVSGF